MTDFEIVLCCFLVPLLMVLMYIAGKHDMIKLIGEMIEASIKDLEERKRNVISVAYICDEKACSACNHENCYYTTDIDHAKHFQEIEPGKFMEICAIPPGKVKGEED